MLNRLADVFLAQCPWDMTKNWTQIRSVPPTAMALRDKSKFRMYEPIQACKATMDHGDNALDSAVANLGYSSELYDCSDVITTPPLKRHAKEGGPRFFVEPTPAAVKNRAEKKGFTPTGNLSGNSTSSAECLSELSEIESRKDGSVKLIGETEGWQTSSFFSAGRPLLPCRMVAPNLFPPIHVDRSEDFYSAQCNPKKCSEENVCSYFEADGEGTSAQEGSNGPSESLRLSEEALGTRLSDVKCEPDADASRTESVEKVNFLSMDLTAPTQWSDSELIAVDSCITDELWRSELLADGEDQLGLFKDMK